MRGAPRSAVHEPADRRDLEGPSRSEGLIQARRMAAALRRLPRIKTRHDRRLHILDLLHNEPQLLVEVVLVLTES